LKLTGLDLGECRSSELQQTISNDDKTFLH